MNGPQSVLDPAGAGGASIAFLWWAMFAMGTVVFIAVVIALVLAIRRERGTGVHDRSSSEADTADHRAATRWVSIAVGITAVILFATFALSLITSRSTRSLAVEGAREIEVTGVQWWWDVRYLDADPTRVVRVANELHLPAGEPVLIRLRSRDVIHSFWVPNLHGKLDAIPGRENELWIRADRPGTYRGQCAEFCGLQHAKMAMVVVVHEPAAFAAWLESELLPAAAPTDPLAIAGADVFLREACSTCHAIRGTEARGQVAPDLTHVGRRLSLAAGELPNTDGHLASWILDPQAHKPGSHMPHVGLSSDQLGALVAYLRGLR